MGAPLPGLWGKISVFLMGMGSGSGTYELREFALPKTGRAGFQPF